MGRTVLVRWVECGALRAREMLIRRAPVAGCYRQWVRPGSFQVGCGVVPAVDQDLLVVLLRDDLNPQQVRRDDLLAVSYVLVSFTLTFLPFSCASAIATVTFARSRVSLKMVEYCSPAMIDFTEPASAS